MRMHRWRLKALLREICRRRIGARIANRPKQGFTVPVESWLLNRWKSNVAALRGDTELVREGWIQRGALDSAADAALVQGRAPVQLWYLLVLENWLTARKGATVQAGVQ
jgi:asparagine synthase (glutamine-hydrolysing)